MSFLRKQESKIKYILKKQVFYKLCWIPAFAGMTSAIFIRLIATIY
ncbi:hypothetical protein [Rickettsia asembonensis]|nr:hypothetical protein [Rickettsia asembonensis]